MNSFKMLVAAKRYPLLSFILSNLASSTVFHLCKNKIMIISTHSFWIVLKIQVQAAKDLSDAIAEQKREATNELEEVKVAWEQSLGQARIEQEQFKAAISEQKLQIDDKLSEVKVALEKSQEQAKLAQGKLEIELTEQKVQTSKELCDTTEAFEQSLEQAKVSLH